MSDEVMGYGYMRFRRRPMRYWWKWGVWIWQAVGVFSDNSRYYWIASAPSDFLAEGIARKMAERKGVPYLGRLPGRAVDICDKCGNEEDEGFTTLDGRYLCLTCFDDE